MVELCRYCDKPIDDQSKAVAAKAYWHPVNQLSHKECLKPGFNKEAYDCQKIDADCNDCGYFRATRDTGQRIRYGTCLRADKPDLPKWAIQNGKDWPYVVARPSFCSGFKCFVHRADLNRRD